MIYPATDQYIDLAKAALDNGDVIVYPTDTLYGFGVDATNTEAIQRLNRLKGRSQPLSIVLESIDHMHDFAEIEGSIEKEVQTLFPGNYTVLLPAKNSDLSPFVQNGSSKIGIRIPDHFFPVNLVKLFGKPIITTSINRHGNDPLNDVTQVEIDFPNVDIFEDSKHNPSKGSTIIDYTTSPPSIVREGDGPYPL
ncbi:MAG: L-threonylcarbamoyladenylate synthase [Candidatus Marinimicrobia bacterium]|jgi:L-threonylcarbamoyladenylate synthase|nr:L-threonylcarbamoyladenylate synthase [Candidatus Neomarinimicrobiota bacterium]MDP6852700.1 L-threonylcarbamoyladenylate synthase [Candidatus Neomarinimicrobiota bacterium]MDP6936330.1 L-threonylcarbamoyladenylate synthase [Candidatus Neomarinimicrobiota bacterium]